MTDWIMKAQDKNFPAIPRSTSVAEAAEIPVAKACCVPLTARSLHDLTGPVNQVGLMVDLLLRRYKGHLDSDAETLLELIRGSTGRLQTLLAGLSTYMRTTDTPGPYCYCDGDGLLADSIASIQQTIDEHSALVTFDTLPELYCNPIQIRLAFANLIANSIQFRGQNKPQIHVSANPTENDWIFSITDNGTGIAPRHYDRIFEVFANVHQQGRQGAGVGLAIVRRIIERHDGRIWVESQTGQGATFFFTLPRRDDHSKYCASLHQSELGIDISVATPTAPAALAFPVRAEDLRVPKHMHTKPRNRTILLVDDQRADREVIRSVLVEDGYEVLVASDYTEAVRVHQEHTGGIHLLLTAIALPGNNGYELARTIFRTDPNLKVLFVSGHTGAEVSRFYNMPVTGPHLLDKPVQTADLLARVGKATRSRKPRLRTKGAY